MAKISERNIGWRIDYVIVSERIKDALLQSDSPPDVIGSYHYPVMTEIDEELLK